MKKVISTALALLLAFSCLFITASAAGSSFSSASNISFNTTYSDSITSSNADDYYKFTISSSGTVSLNFQAEFAYAEIYIYNSNKEEVWKNSYITANSSGEISFSKDLAFTSGTYFLKVSRYSTNHTGYYDLRLSYSSSSESFKETGSGSDNSFNTANSISLNTKYYGMLCINDESDYYKFTLSSSGSITIDFKSSCTYAKLYIYNSSKAEVWKDSYVTANSSGEISYTKKLDLSAGTYYFRVCRYSSDYNTSSKYFQNYNFKLISSSGSGSSGSVSLSLSNSSVSIKEGSSTKVTCSCNGSYSGSLTMSYSVANESIATCEWGSWNNGKPPLTINGINEGSTTITIKLKDKNSGTVLDTKTIKVTVTAPSSSNDGGTDGGNDGGNSSGGTNLFALILDIILFPIRLVLRLLGLY